MLKSTPHLCLKLWSRQSVSVGLHWQSSLPLAATLFLTVARPCPDVDKLGALHVLAFYVIMGLGVDDVYVFYNAFQNAKRDQECCDDRGSHIVSRYTVTRAIGRVVTSGVRARPQVRVRVRPESH